MDANTLARETWIHVFECINSQADLARVIRTSTTFYSLAIRVLYRRITWMDPRHFAHSLSFWTTHPALVDVPRSLTIGVSEMTRTSSVRFNPAVAIVALDGTWERPMLAAFGLDSVQPDRHQSLRTQPTFFASPPLYQALNHRLSAFTMLESLVFCKTLLPGNLYVILHGLPQLRRLFIQFCTLPPRQLDPNRDNSLLPITDLTLWCIKSDLVPDVHYIQALSLTTAHNLRTLRTDWTTLSARFFTQDDHEPRYQIPPRLDNIEFRLPTLKMWPTEPWAAQTFFIGPLSSLLTRCSNILRLSLVNFMPPIPWALPPHALPHLQSYSGPLSTVLTVTAGRPVVHLNVLNSGKKLTDVLHMLSVLENRQGMKTLSVSIDSWEDEILYPISLFYPSLEKLEILYNNSGPSEYTLLSMGSRFLCRLADLHTLQILNPHPEDCAVHPTLEAIRMGHSSLFPWPLATDTKQACPIPSISYDEIDLKDLILAWNKSCRNLREVQLVGTSVWRRAFDGDEWCKRTVETDEAGISTVFDGACEGLAY